VFSRELAGVKAGCSGYCSADILIALSAKAFSISALSAPCVASKSEVCDVKSSQVKLPLIKTSDNRTSFTSNINENKVVTKSAYNKIMSQYKMSQIGRRSQALNILKD